MKIIKRNGDMITCDTIRFKGNKIIWWGSGYYFSNGKNREGSFDFTEIREIIDEEFQKRINELVRQNMLDDGR